MVSFIVYDLAFLLLFTLVAIVLFHKTRVNWKRHGWIFLYHSKFGLKFIDWTARKFSGILRPMQYLVITSGYVLMGFIIWLMSFSVWKYVTQPIPEQLQNVPPIAPLIPYFPRIFGLDAFFPPLYFTYFLIALAIVAISHEFAHGIYARLYKIKVKTTGLAFFGPFFGAFVEPDEKVMMKAPNEQQMTILAAGTFANVVMTVLFLFVLWGFFSVSFMPAGVNFNAYPQAVANLDSIETIGGNYVSDIGKIPELAKDGQNEVVVNGEIYLVPGSVLDKAVEVGAERIVLFEDAPAVRAELRSPILKIDGETITGPDSLRDKLSQYNPGDTITVVSLDNELEKSQQITLADREGQAYLGVGFMGVNEEGFVRGLVFGTMKKIRDPLVYYVPSWDGDFSQFIYDLLWWIIVINILVALFNMLPVSILDGGRFFYLTVLSLTRREKIAKKAFNFATWVIVAMLMIMMIRWVFVFFS
jgi:membrane-associated protease RseP (regulator of RpoE activity)